MIEVRRTSQKDYTENTKLLISGFPGSGKTLMASTAKDNLYASTDPRFMSIADRDIPVVDIKSTEDLFELRACLNRPAKEREELMGFPVETLTLDTVNDLQRIMQRERLKEMNRESFITDDWVWLGERLPTIIESILNLPLNVIFICHLANKNNDDSGSGWFQPALSGQSAQFIASKVDVSGVLVATSPIGVESDRKDHLPPAQVIRRFITAPSERYPYVKDHSGKLPYEFEVNFKDDFERMRDLVYANSHEIPDSETRTVTLPEGEKKEPKTQLIKAKDRPASPEEVKARIAQAKNSEESVVSPVSEKLAVKSVGGKKVLGRPKKDKVMQESITPAPLPDLEEDVENKPKEKRKLGTTPKKNEVKEKAPEPVDFIVKDKDGKEYTSNNALPEGVIADPVEGGKVGWYCEKTGRELPRAAKAEMSKIKFNNSVLHPDVWEK